MGALLYDGSGRLLGWFALSMAFGAAVYFLPPDPFPPLWTAGAGLCAALAFTLLEATRRYGRLFPQQAVLLVILAGLASGFSSGALRNAVTPITAIPVSLDRVMVEGWVAGIDPRETGARVRLRVHAMSGVPADQTPTFVRMTQMRGDPPFPGRFVRCYGALRPPPGPGLAGDYDFARDAHFQRLGGVGFVYGTCEPGSLGPAEGHEASLALASLRRRVAERVYAASGPEAGGFAAALVSGDRSLMPEADREALRASGLAHLLAISGLHLGLVGGMVYLVMRRGLAFWEWFALRVPVQKPAAAAALIVLACYFVISGMSVATQRAFLMAAVFFGAILFDRAALTARSLALAMILITLFQPETVVTPGFQMSFAATGALIAMFRLWNDRQRDMFTAHSLTGRVRSGAAAVIISSIVGSAATTPFALAHFDRVAPLGLIANLVAMPLVSLFVLPAAALSLVLWPFGAADLGLALLGAALELILAVAHWTASLNDQITLGTGPPKPFDGSEWLLAALAIGILGIHEGRARILPALLIASSAAVWTAKPAPLAWVDGSGWVAARLADGDHLYWAGDGRAPLKPLRFSDLEAETCPLPCTLPLPAGELSVTRKAGKGGLTASVRLGTDASAEKYSLQPRQTLTLTLRGGTIRHHPNRKWSPVSDPSRNDE